MNTNVGQTPVRGTVMRFDKKPGEGDDNDEEDWGEEEDEDDEDDEEEEWEEEW